VFYEQKKIAFPAVEAVLGKSVSCNEGTAVLSKQSTDQLRSANDIEGKLQ